MTLTILHPDYPDIFDSVKAEEFFHYCLKKFERLRNENMVEDSEMADQQDNDADEKEGGDEKKLDINKKVIKMKLSEPTYYREEEPEEEDEDDSEAEDEDDIKMLMAKLTVKEKARQLLSGFSANHSYFRSIVQAMLMNGSTLCAMIEFLF